MYQIRNESLFFLDNDRLEVGDKFSKLNKICFSMEWFTGHLLQFFTTKRQNLTFRWTATIFYNKLLIPTQFLKNFL